GHHHIAVRVRAHGRGEGRGDRLPGTGGKLPLRRSGLRAAHRLAVGSVRDRVGKRDANLEREAPKVRDMPAPRKSEGAAGGAMQRIFAWPYRGILAFLLWTGLSPNQLTLLALAAN